MPDLREPLRQTAAHPWFERLARFGIAAKGFVYFVVGLLAFQAAIGVGGKTTDTSGALQQIVNRPFGKGLLMLITIGIVGYTLWRLVQAAFDPEHQGEKTDAKRIAQRMGYAFSAIAYIGLALTAVKLILGSGGADGNATQDWTAKFLAQPFGQWIVALAGAIAIGVGLSYLIQAYGAEFQRHLNLNTLSDTKRTWIKRLGQFGTTARGIVFAIIGVFLVQAARRSDASQAKGLGDALATLAQQPYGSWLLGLVALGLIAYSLYSLVEARYRQIDRP